MSIWRRLQRGLDVLFNRDAADRDFSDEIEHYLEQATAAHLAEGLSLEDARRAARVDMGSHLAARDEVRSAGWESLLESVFADVRVAVRRLAAAPGFTAVAVVTLAVGIGAATSVFSVVDGVLLRSLPYTAADRIVRLGQRDLALPGPGGNTSIDDYRDWAAAARSFSAIGVLTNAQPTLTGAGEPERVPVAQVSAGLFDVFHLQPFLGRPIEPTDNAVGAPRVAVLRYDFWQGRLGGDKSIVRKTITLDQVPVRVIGVMPSGFTGPDRLDRPIWENFTVWGDGRANHSEGVWALLHPGVTLAQAQSEVEQIGSHLAGIHPEDKGTTISVEPLRARLVGDLGRPLYVLLGASFFLLLIACANLSNLLLANGLSRAPEVAVRTALGAARVRIVRQLVTESAVLGAAGAGGALLVARGVMGVLMALGPDEVRAHPPALNLQVLALATGLAGLTTLLIGVVPAFRASAVDPQLALREAGPRSGGGRGRGTRRALAIAQLALAVILLSGGGLVLKSYRHVLRIAPGIRPDHLLTANVALPTGPRYDGPAATAFFEQLMQRVGRVPAVQSVATTSLVPFSGDEALFGVTRIQGEPERPGSDMLLADRYAVSPSYFRTLAVRLVRGRVLSEDDQVTGVPVCVVDEEFARRAFGMRDPLGRAMQLTGRPEYARIVGVVEHVRTYGLDAESQGQIYVSLAQYPWRWSSLVVRTTGDPLLQVAAVKQAVRELDPNQPVTDVATMDGMVAGLLRDRQFTLALLSAFAATATLLAAVGLYGVIAFGVTQRRREFGLRLALGAGPWRIARLVLIEGGVIAVAGTAVGVAGALVATRLVGSILFEVSPRDTSVIGTVVAVLIGISLVACLVPARRAMREDAAQVLRAE
jgi:predicted permease